METFECKLRKLLHTHKNKILITRIIIDHKIRSLYKEAYDIIRKTLNPFTDYCFIQYLRNNDEVMHDVWIDFCSDLLKEYHYVRNTLALECFEFVARNAVIPKKAVSALYRFLKLADKKHDWHSVVKAIYVLWLGNAQLKRLMPFIKSWLSKDPAELFQYWSIKDISKLYNLCYDNYPEGVEPDKVILKSELLKSLALIIAPTKSSSRRQIALIEDTTVDDFYRFHSIITSQSSELIELSFLATYSAFRDEKNFSEKDYERLIPLLRDSIDILLRQDENRRASIAGRLVYLIIDTRFGNKIVGHFIDIIYNLLTMRSVSNNSNGEVQHTENDNDVSRAMLDVVKRLKNPSIKILERCVSILDEDDLVDLVYRAGFHGYIDKLCRIILKSRPISLLQNIGLIKYTALKSKYAFQKIMSDNNLFERFINAIRSERRSMNERSAS